ncbi:MAG: hypothetical protein HON90_08470 [Halobacteriovoraceae bacterium]|jgi:hypothetical protein|nr:hypothetical protein [Halobacteriovoraceae bacterium]
MKASYKEINSVQEFETIIHHSNAEDIVIWQNNYGDRVKYNVEQIGISRNKENLNLLLCDYKKDISPDKVIYIKLKFRETLFKAKIKLMDGQGRFSLFIPVRSNVIALELRAHPRVEFNLIDEKMVMLNIVNSKGGQKDHFLSFRLHDISQQGVGLIVSNQNKKLLTGSDEVYITQIGEVLLSSPIKIDKCHMSESCYKYRGKNICSNKVGFQLQGDFASRDLDEFLGRGDSNS